MAYGFRYIVEPTTENYFWLVRFREGDPAALRYIYPHVFKSLVNYGKRIVSDEFEVKTIVQEAILKVWTFRERVETMWHAYRFMRLVVRWNCLNTYKNRKLAFQRALVRSDFLEDIMGFYDLQLQDAEQAQATALQERVEQVYKVVPYLPHERRTIFILHFGHGLSYKRIARRFATSHQLIQAEVQKCLEELRRMLAVNKADTVRSISYAVPEPDEPAPTPPAPETIPEDMWRIFRYRMEQKMGFEQIAAIMRLSATETQQTYIEAHRRLRQLKTTSHVQR